MMVFCSGPPVASSWPKRKRVMAATRSMFEIVGADLQVGGDFLGSLGDLNFARRGSQANLHGVGISGEDLRPFAPRGAVALVNDDVAEIIFGIERGEEIGCAVFAVHVEGLIRGDVDARVAGVV